MFSYLSNLNPAVLPAGPPARLDHMAMADWSSLPADLINLIADRFLATNDLDYYMTYRAVCSTWRSATVNPKYNPDDPRFHLKQWVMLDEHEFVKNDDTCGLFVNATTGRFLRKDMPLLRKYYFVTSTTDGHLILADRSSPHAACVLNPFTGFSIHFMAPVPSERFVMAYLVCPSSSTLVLVCGSFSKLYSANPNSERFHEEEYCVLDDTYGSRCKLDVVGNICRIADQQMISLMSSIFFHSETVPLPFTSWNLPGRCCSSVI